MEDHSKSIQRLIQEGRPERLSDALGVDVTPETHHELLASLDKIIEAYRSPEDDGILEIFSKTLIDQSILKDVDDCITSLQIATPWLEFLENFQFVSEGRRVRDIKKEELKKLRAKNRSRVQRINSLLKDLQRLRGLVVDFGYTSTSLPELKITIVEKKNFLPWALSKVLRSYFPGRDIINKQINYGIYQLLRLSGLEETESNDPAEMIRKRIERFAKTISPEMSSKILTYLTSRL